MKETLSIVKSNIILSAEYFLLEFDNPFIAAASHPGRFVMVQVSDGTDPLLRRPFSIHSVIENRGFTLLIRKAGRGTEIMMDFEAGDRISVLGPLGGGFEMDGFTGGNPVFFVGGGIGIAPLYFALERVIGKSVPAAVFYGTRTSSELVVLDRLKDLPAELHVCTDDGTYGAEMLVSGLLSEFLDNNPPDKADILTCGPRAMLREVVNIGASHGIPVQVSYEERMACGMGACLGCTCPTVKGYKKTCVDGPVFRGEEIEWE